MTISSTNRKAGPFIGNDSTTACPFAFKVFNATDLLVVRLNSDTGVETTLVRNTDYTVTLNSNQNSNPGGTVTLSSAIATGFTVTITTNVAELQPTDLTNQGGFFPQVVTTALDRLTVLIQQLSEKMGRALKLPISASAGVNPELPFPEGNKILGWNAAGTGLQNMDATTLATIAAFGTAVPDLFTGDGTTTQFSLTRNPGALGNLDVAIGGVTQRPGIDYTWAGGTTITFTSAPPTPSDGSANVLARYIQALPQGYSDASLVLADLSVSGSAPRNVQAKMFETISVTDFSGVDKTGATSSLAGFLAALAYASTQTAGGKGFTVAVPNGVYRLDGAVAIPDRVKIVGAGARSTIFILSGTSAGFVFDSVTNAALIGARIGLADGTNQKAVTLKTTTGTVRWCEIADLEIAANVPRDQHYGIHATATGGQIVTENAFDRITTFQVNRPIYRADIEGNQWTNLHLAEHGKAVACPAIDGSSLADFYQGRAAGTTLDGAVGFSDSGARSTAILAIDIGGGSRKAVVLGNMAAHTVIIQRPELLTPLGDVGMNNTVIDSGVVISSLQLTTGPALTTANFSLSSEWGSTASVSGIKGNDGRVTFTVSSSGTGQAAYPTVTFYGSQGDWPTGVDIVPQVTRNGGNQPTAAGFSADGTTNGWSFRFYGTPVAGETYTFTVTV